MKTLVYISSCGLDSQGRPGSFFLQELPWLLAHFDRVVLCSHEGVAEVTQPNPERISAKKPLWGRITAVLRTPLQAAFWQELAHMRHDRRLNAVNAVKLYLFAVRGLTLQSWTEGMLRKGEDVTLYSFWMSYDGYAAALSKRRDPRRRAIARGHHFDINPAANPMNPYLLKRFTVRWLDAVYPISQDALACLRECAPLPEEKLHVVALGSFGSEATQRFPAPAYQDGVFRLVSCAAVIERKQIPVLIDALALWNEGRVRWTHIGGGPDEPAVRAYAAQKLGECHHIDFEITGRVDLEQVQRYYTAQPFDVFVNTSRSEGVPVSIMEAMRAGVLTVAPRINGIPELVDDAVGRLYAPEDGAAGVYEALLALYHLPKETAETMRATAQARWNERCRSERLITRLFPDAAKGDERA